VEGITNVKLMTPSLLAALVSRERLSIRYKKRAADAPDRFGGYTDSFVSAS
jgi:hypothetical protein